MATGNSDTTSKEHQVLQKYYARLTKAITNSATLLILAGELYSAELISVPTQRKVATENSSASHEAKTFCLLNDLMSVVALDCTKFTEIISVLQNHPPILSAIAKEMKRECGKKTIIIHYINITEPTVTIIINFTDQQHIQSESTEIMTTQSIYMVEQQVQSKPFYTHCKMNMLF